jgi:hypothetical protein
MRWRQLARQPQRIPIVGPLDMHDQIAIASDLFEHREVKPHVINPCGFGEDLAAWLKGKLQPLAAEGFEISEPIQEDYGWGLWVTKAKDPFWIAVSYCGEGPTDEPGQWVVSVTYDPGLNILKRLFHTPDPGRFNLVRDRVWDVIKSTDGIKIIDRDG